MTRSNLLGAVSAAALACVSTAAFAQVAINTGGATLPSIDYPQEFTQFNNAVAAFTPYAAVGSGAGQTAFLNNDSTQLYGVGTTPVTVHMGMSDALLSSTQITGWTTATVDQPTAADLIQLPSVGVGIAIVVNNNAVTKNGGTTLNDNQLCGVFSGKITDFSNAAMPAGLTPGPIAVDYRSDGSGTSFIFTQHLAAACNSNNSSFPLATPTSSGFSATKTFANIFATTVGGTGAAPNNFHGYSASIGVATDMENNQTGTNGLTKNSAMTYISPDFTTDITTSQAKINNAPPTLLIANVVGTDGKAYLPVKGSANNVTNGLAHPQTATASHLGVITAPTARDTTIVGSTTQAANDPESWVPQIPFTTKGYPIVGYTTFEIAQCYANETVATQLIAFLKDHYSNATYQAIERNNGFVPVTTSKLNKVAGFILNQVLANTPVKGVTWNYNINNAATCQAAGATGTGTVVGR